MADPIIVPAPAPGRETKVVHDDIRHFIWDRSLADNPLELDLEFSDEEIGHARRHAAQMFNSIPPFVVTIRADNVPSRWEYGIKLGTVYHLCLAKLIKLQRSDLDYSAGNMVVDLTKRRIEHLTKLAAAMKEEATSNIKTLKLVANLEDGYACF